MKIRPIGHHSEVRVVRGGRGKVIMCTIDNVGEGGGGETGQGAPRRSAAMILGTTLKYFA